MAGVSRREVDRRLGWGENYLSQLLRGNVELKVCQLFDVLGATGLSERDFFADLFPVAAPPSRAATAPYPAADASPSGSRRSRDDQIEEALRVLVQEAVAGRSEQTERRLLESAADAAQHEQPPGPEDQGRPQIG
ncbi:MAG: hypothetical protein M3O15_05990 [Acidobacteriota bacterium]|nr:hypothetical protein [Acidobacteriota bacterium]